jgi:hypothetical protein
MPAAVPGLSGSVPTIQPFKTTINDYTGLAVHFILTGMLYGV